MIKIKLQSIMLYKKGLFVLYFMLLSTYNFANNIVTHDQKATQSITAFNHKSDIFTFVENKGQIFNSFGERSNDVKFITEQKGCNMYLLNNGIAYQFHKYKLKEVEETESAIEIKGVKEIKVDSFETYRMNMELVGANINAQISKEGESNDYINYYNRGVLNVHSYKKITYHEVYPNIDWVIYFTDENELKYDFVVKVGGNPNMIKIKYTYFDSIYVMENGGLNVVNPFGIISENKPISFQGTKTINTHFLLDNDIVTYSIENYDKTKELIIDPTLVFINWATYYGGICLTGHLV